MKDVLSTHSDNKRRPSLWTAIFMATFCVSVLLLSIAQIIHTTDSKQSRLAEINDHLKSRVALYYRSNRSGLAVTEATTVANSNIPVYYISGTANQASRSSNWPSDCPKPMTTVSNRAVTLACHSQRILIYNETQAVGNPVKITFWTSITTPSIASSLFSSKIFVSIAMVSLLIAAAISAVTSRLLFSPLQQVIKLLDRIARGKYDRRLEINPHKELAILEETINRMVEEISSRDANIRRQAFRDSITGLDNSAFVHLSLQERLNYSREPLALILCSIENLREIYEIMGQATRDAVLRKFSKRLRRICPHHITLARMEGFEFCMLLPLKTLLNTSHVDLQRVLSFNLRVNGCHAELKCHAGIAHYPSHGHTAETLLRRAEMAKHQAINRQLQCVSFEPSIESEASDRLALLADLRKAIQDEAFELYFQPKLHLGTGCITQVEGLIRWIHPERGVTNPGYFIELAERTGLVCELTKWALKEGYRRAMELAHKNIGISLNISARDLEDQGFLEFATALHAQHPDTTKLITLEITESCTMFDPDQASRLLTALTKLGFKISIDDYGTGYSSLSYLKRFPASEIKVDRSLVTDADKNPDSEVILQSTIDMGHTMGMVITVEGVETREEYNLMERLGADYVQGFFLARPMRFSDLLVQINASDQPQVTQPA